MLKSRWLFFASSTTLGVLAASASVAYKYRLRPSKDRSFHEQLVSKTSTDGDDSNSNKTLTTAIIPRNKLEPTFFIENWLLQLARLIAMGGSANFGAWLFTITGKKVESISGKELFDSLVASRPRPRDEDRPSSLLVSTTTTTSKESFLSSNSLNDLAIQPDWEDDENNEVNSLDNLPEDGDKAWPGLANEVPLITVCNHSSMLDDPGLTSVLLDPSMNMNHSRMRWGICTEEVCFKYEGLASYFSLGKAVPVQRGGGLHQKGVAELQFALNRGEWLHIFPEGRTWQEGGNPLRDQDGRWCSASGRCSESYTRVGPLKWGVGKFLANARVLPIVIPYFHMGMQPIVPQDRNNKVAHKDGALGLLNHVLSTPADITVKFGEPVYYKDIIQDYHISARQRALRRAEQRRLRKNREGSNSSSSSSSPLYVPLSDSNVLDSSEVLGKTILTGGKDNNDEASSISKSISYPTPKETKRCFTYDILDRVLQVSKSDNKTDNGKTDEKKGNLMTMENSSSRNNVSIVVPSRALANGNIVPAYVDAPLRVRPPDYKLLTPAEEALEDIERFKLYSRLSDRVHKSLISLSRDVLQYRKERGVKEPEFQ
jgi:1-acyl-sn-glycerol-3-phosphate acyltransferase